jgi:hypothetical protein
MLAIVVDPIEQLERHRDFHGVQLCRVGTARGS